MEDMEGERSGFFKPYHMQVLEQITPADLERFGHLTSDQERFRFVWSLPVIHASQARQDTTRKCLSAATTARKAGNQCFQAGLFSQALAHYSESVRKAPQGFSKAKSCSETQEDEEKDALSLALANRSAALFHLGRYQEALQDTFHAANCGYPARLLCKLLHRRAQCFAVLGRKDFAREAIFQAEDLALKHLPNTSPQLIRAKFFAELAKVRLSLDQQLPVSTQGLDYDKCLLSGTKNGTQLPQLVHGPHSTLPGAAQVVEIKVSPEAGRYAITTKNLQPGEVVAVEKAYASVLQPLKYPSNCHHCFKATAALLPCPHCVSASFCSDSCREAALTTYHATECQLLDHLFQAGISITCYLALRIVTQSPLDYFCQLQSYLRDTSSAAASPAQRNGYLRIYDLVSHSDKRSATDYFNQTLMATFLLKCLRSGGYFAERKFATTPALPMDDPLDRAGKLSDEVALIGSILLRNLQVVQFNTHEVAELQLPRPNSLEGSKSVFLGAAIFPTVAMFNHSCNPGIVRYFVGDTMIARTIRGHVAGEVLAENYGPIFTQNVREERQRTLKSRYWFDCTCEACTHNWPLYTQMTDQTWQFRCTTPNCATSLSVSVESLNPFVRCRRCNKQTNILQGLKMLQETEATFQQGVQLMNDYRVVDALKIFLSTLAKLECALCPPFRDYHLTQEAIRKCMLSQGNVSIAST